MMGCSETPAIRPCGEGYGQSCARWDERQVRLPLVIQRAQIGVNVADARYRDQPENVAIEAVKSPPSRTPIYRWKKRHVLAHFGIAITEIES